MPTTTTTDVRPVPLSTEGLADLYRIASERAGRDCWRDCLHQTTDAPNRLYWTHVSSGTRLVMVTTTDYTGHGFVLRTVLNVYVSDGGAVWNEVSTRTIETVIL